MTRNKTLLVLGMAVATMAGCRGGQADTAAAPTSAPQADPSQATVLGSAVDAAATLAAQAATSGELKAAIAIKSAIAMHAQTSVPTLACGLDTKSSLDASKTEVRKLARAEGIDDVTFDQVYAAAERKTRERWDSAPAAKRAEACEEWKTMTEHAVAVG